MADDPADLLARYRRLTARQQTLVRYLADAASRAEIAEALGISRSLVDKETAEVMRAFDLQEEGLTRTQRCVELRRMYLQLRRQERSEAAPVAPDGGEPSAEPASTPPPAIPAPEPTTAEQPTPLVLLSPPITTPPTSSAPGRWWPLPAAVVVLALIAGAWRVTHGGEQAALAGATAGGTTETPAVIAAPPATATIVPSTTPTPLPPSPPPTAKPTATPVPMATATANPAATPLNLAGKVASARPGTPLRLGQPVASIIDQQAKPYDIYALQLKAGQTLHVAVTASSSAFGVTLAAPGAVDLIGAPGIPLGAFLCNFQNPCQKDFAIAADGAYTLVIGTNEGAGVRYTLVATAR